MLPGGRGGEIIIVAAIALIVVGPRDLPKLLRQLGRFVGKMRGMADDFRASFEDMARQSELDDLRKEVEALRQNQPVFSDIKNQMTSIGSDINQSMKLSPPTTPPYTPPVDAKPADPQMEGLPPGTAVDVAPDGAPPAITPEVAAPPLETPPEVIVKKPRTRKKAAP